MTSIPATVLEHIEDLRGREQRNNAKIRRTISFGVECEVNTVSAERSEDGWWHAVKQPGPRYAYLRIRIPTEPAIVIATALARLRAWFR